MFIKIKIIYGDCILGVPRCQGAKLKLIWDAETIIFSFLLLFMIAIHDLIAKDDHIL